MNRHNEGHRERKLSVEREAQEEDLARRRRQMMRMRQEKRRKRRIRVYTLLGAGTVAILAACVGIAGLIGRGKERDFEETATVSSQKNAEGNNRTGNRTSDRTGDRGENLFCKNHSGDKAYERRCVQ